MSSTSPTRDCAFADGRCTVCGAPEINARQLCGTWRPGLGDYIHAGLGAVGITPERVAATMGVEDCGCEGRRQWLNQAGKALGIGSEPRLTGHPDSEQS